MTKDNTMEIGLEGTIKRTAEFVGYAAVLASAFVTIWRYGAPRIKFLLSKSSFSRLESRIESIAAKVNILIRIRGESIYVCDPDGNNVWVSEPLADLFGMDTSEMHGNGWSSAIDYRDRNRAVEHWRRCIAANVSYHDEYTIIVGGKEKRIVTEAFKQTNDGGNTVLYVGYVREVIP